MKKFVSFLISAIMIIGTMPVFAQTHTALPATFNVYVDSEMFLSDKPVLVIDGSTYLPLKATGEALGVSVLWNSDKRCVEVSSTKTAPSSENTVNAVANLKDSFTAEDATFKIYVNNNEFVSDKPILVIDGSTYLPLKALGDILGVDVSWNDICKRVEVGNCYNLIADTAEKKAVADIVTNYSKSLMSLSIDEALENIAPNSALYQDILSMGDISKESIVDGIITALDEYASENDMEGLFNKCQPAAEKLVDDIFALFSLRVNNIDISENKAIIRCTATVPDYTQIDLSSIPEQTEKLMTSEKYAAKIADIMISPSDEAFAMFQELIAEIIYDVMSSDLKNLPATKTDTTITLEKINGHWLITADE